MHSEDLRALIAQGESETLEFKEARKGLNKDVFESVCAFLNRQGGHVVLGVKDNGTVQGIDPALITKIKQELVTGLNNPQILSPPCALAPETVELEGRQLIVLYVPDSSEVHSSRGKIFERYEDGDLNISGQTHKIAQIYLRKQKIFTENTVYPYVELSDLRSDLIDRARRNARLFNSEHPWGAMDDLTLLRSARLCHKDYATGKTGFTLAAVMLFGHDEVIQNILSYYRIDCILRVKDTLRYDDRIDVRTNLLDAYGLVMGFIEKHLPDPFYLEGDLRVSLRHKIFREAVANMLAHREYALVSPTRVIIERDTVRFENASRPVQFGLIDPQHFTPHPKNPTILRFFREMKLSEELGSGLKNTYHYVPLYTPGRQATFSDGSVFVTEIPIPPFTNLVSGPVNAKSGSANTENGSANTENGSANTEDGIQKPLSEADYEAIIRQVMHLKLQPKTLMQLTEVLRMVHEHEGQSRLYYEQMLKKSTRTVLRYFSQLKAMDLIAFEGGTKNGGYYLTSVFDACMKKMKEVENE
jgi:ATP-dependent DNA helicase RecG